MARVRNDELAAQVCIRAALPGCSVELHDDGSRPSMYDLKIVCPGGTTGAVEVTAAADAPQTGLWKEVRKRSLIRQEPNSAAEIGDITRFRNPGQLASWAGLTPRPCESGTRVIRGRVPEQGSRMLRWAVTEASWRQPAGTRPRQVKDAIIARRGTGARGIARTAAARIMLARVSCSMRDGQIRRAISQAA